MGQTCLCISRMWTKMRHVGIRAFSALFLLLIRMDAKSTAEQLCFRNDFIFAVSTAAYQNEGDGDTARKGDITRGYKDPQLLNHSKADLSVNFYRRIKQDVTLLGELGVQYYRFSISWPRIMPAGVSNVINNDSIQYYQALLSELESKNISAIVTMHHWELPANLQELGGWTNQFTADYFVDYAQFLFKNFGDRVAAWITFDDPASFCDNYGGDNASGRRSSGVEEYMCAHNVLKAQGRVYKMFKEKFDINDKGYLGISLNTLWMEPATSSKEDIVAAEIARQFLFGWFAHPIFSLRGDYPRIMRERVNLISKRQGFLRSRLPYFTKEEVEIIRGSADFLGLGHYTTNLVMPADAEMKMQPSFYNDVGVKFLIKKHWPKTNSTWLRVVPWGFRKLLNWIKNSYDNPPVVVTENGMALQKGLEDSKRVQYIDSYLHALHAAIFKDNCNVGGYTYSALDDNFEWRGDLSERFGLHEVDSSSNLTRTPRLSAYYFSSVARTSCLPDLKNWHPEAEEVRNLRYIPLLLKFPKIKFLKTPPGCSNTTCRFKHVGITSDSGSSRQNIYLPPKFSIKTL